MLLSLAEDTALLMLLVGEVWRLGLVEGWVTCFLSGYGCVCELGWMM
jgi:hypothetical protein